MARTETVRAGSSHGKDIPMNPCALKRFRPAFERLEDRLTPALSPLHVVPGQHYLADQSNTPFLIQGDSAWELIISTTQPEAQQYLNDRAAKGFNLLLVNLIDHLFGPNAPANMAGNFPFFNPA